MALPTPLAAQEAAATATYASLDDGTPTNLANVLPGDQLVAQGVSGTQSFAGQEVLLDQFTGVFGASADLAYVMVMDGTLVHAGESLGAGKILMIPPFGGSPAVERFDAERFMASLPQGSEVRFAGLSSALAQVIDNQSSAKWWGIVSPTNMSANAPSGLAVEQTKRELVTHPGLQGLRFSAIADEAELERRTVETFVAAAMRGEADLVAALLDPDQFFGTQLTAGGAGGARALAARQVVQTLRPVSADLGAPDGNVWAVQTANGARYLATRRLGDFIFITSIS